VAPVGVSGLLASTGVRVAGISLLGLAAIAAGAFLVLLGRRGRQATHRH
jgi:hypothetical protein